MKRLGLVRAALALLFPARCCACDQPCDERATFCAACATALEPIERACPRCGLPLPDGGPAAPCLACLRRPPPWSWARAPFQFGGPLAQAIRRLKWGRQPELARPLARLWPAGWAGDCELVAPVPLHPRRLRAREFNQAAVLALAAGRGPPVDVHALERIRDTPPQSALGIGERRANVRGAFRARPERVAGRRVLLVDDVLTTGATAEACTRALIAAGASTVAVLTVARAVT